MTFLDNLTYTSIVVATVRGADVIYPRGNPVDAFKDAVGALVVIFLVSLASVAIEGWVRR